jgi:hypothetical protein
MILAYSSKALSDAPASFWVALAPPTGASGSLMAWSLQCHDLLLDREYLRSTICLLSKGPLPSQQAMAVAIAPNNARPMGRPPFELTKPLPWDDAYMSSSALWDIRISNRPVCDSHVTKLAIRDWPGRLHKDYIKADKARMRQMSSSEASSSAPVVADPASGYLPAGWSLVFGILSPLT